jgi:hypothetical protein
MKKFKKTYEKWANELLSLSCMPFISNNDSKILKSNGFDINDNAKVLETIYTNSILL